MKSKTLLLSSILIFFCFGLTIAQSGFLKIGDIEGESMDNAHKDWIVIESMSQALEKPLPTTGATRTRGSVIFADIVISKKLDKSTPKLMELCAKGQVVPKLEMEMVARDGRPFYKVTLDNVRISSISSMSICDPDCEVMERVTISYSKITWEYWDDQGNKVETSYDARRGM